MNIGENISDSLRYPFTDWVKMLILGIILMIPIVNFIGLGYYLRVISATFAGLNELPEFDEVGDLFINGLKMFVVAIIYMIIPLILYFLAWIFAVPSATFTTGTAVWYVPFYAFSAVSWILFALALILGLLFGLMYYIGIANMALYEGELGAALRFSEILDRINAIGWGTFIIWYIVFIVVSAVVATVIGIIGIILLFILIGILVFIIGYGYLSMFQARSVALLFASSEEDLEPE